MAYRVCTPSLASSTLSLLYLCSLFAMALLGQNMAATSFLVVHLTSAVRYGGKHHRQRREEEHLLGGVSSQPLLPLALPRQVLLYTSVIFSSLQVLLSAAVGPLLCELGLLRGWPKTVLNSLGVWGTSDVFPLVANVVSAVLLFIASVSLCVFLRRHVCRPSRGLNCSFRRWPVLLLAALALLTALVYPSYDYTPLLVVHFLCISSFLISRGWYGRVRFLEVVSKGCTVGSLLLLTSGLLAQSPLEQQLLLSVHEKPSIVWSVMWYEPEWVNIFRSTAVMRKGVQLLFLMCTILASRHVHGTWRIISKREMEAHTEFFTELPFSLWQLFPWRCPATLKSLQLALGRHLPVMVLPLMVLVSLAVMDLVSILMLIASLLGFVLSSSTFVDVLPLCYAFLAFGITLEFVVTVEGGLMQPFLMSQSTRSSVLFGVALVQSCVCSLLVFTVLMFRSTPIKSHYRTVREKKAHIQTAFNRLQNRLGELHDIFSQLCNTTTGIVDRDGFLRLVQEVAYTLRLNSNDIEALWRFLTGGDPVLLHVDTTQSEATTEALSDSSTLHSARRYRLLGNELDDGNHGNNAGRKQERRVKLSHGGVERNHGIANVSHHSESSGGIDDDDEDEDNNNNDDDDDGVNGWNEVRQQLVAMRLIGVAASSGVEEKEERGGNAGWESRRSSSDKTADCSSGMHGGGVAQRTGWWCVHASTLSVSSPGFQSGSISYLDFLVLVSEIERYRMRECGTVYVVAAMVKQIVYLNVSTLTLVAMFMASMTVQTLDVLDGIYLLFFIGLAYLPQYVERCWSVIVAYTVMHITVRFIALAYNNAYHHGASPGHWVTIIGIYTSGNPFALLLYFVLLSLAVFQMRLSRRDEKRTATIQETLQRVEWRRYVTCAFFPQLRQNFLTLTTALVLAMMALFIPRNVFIAGFALLFLLYLSLGAHSERAESLALAVLAAYNLVVLLVIALYHVPDISNRILSRLSNITACQNTTAMAVCASEVGLSMGGDRFVPMSLDLLSWYLAAALCATLCRHRFGARRATEEEEEEEDRGDRGVHVEGREMRLISEPLVWKENNFQYTEMVKKGVGNVTVTTTTTTTTTAAAHNTTHPASKVCVTDLFLCSYADTLGTFTGRCVPLAFEVTRYFYSAVGFIRGLGVNNGMFLALVAVGYASLENFSVLGAAFMLLFLFNYVGVPVIVVSVVSMALTYVYPFFFIPEAPISDSVKRFLNLEKSQKDGGPKILAPLLACAMAVFYIQTRKKKAVLDRESAEYQRRMHRDCAYRTLKERAEGPNVTTTGESQTTPCEPRMSSDTQSDVTGKAKEPHSGFGTLKQHLMFLWNYFRTRFLIDAAFELAMLVVVLGVALTMDRITGFIFGIQFLLMWLFGRVRCTTEPNFALAQEFLIILFLGCMYFIRLGMPDEVTSISILHAEQCGPWEHYFGCDLPIHHFVLMLALVLMQRRMRHLMAVVRATITSVEGTLELGELLRKRARDVEDCRKLIRSDIENVLPVPSRDIIRNPQTVFDLLIAISCAFLPAATFAFVQGVMMASLLGVVEIVVSLCLLAFKRSFAWRWHVVWPYFTLFLFLTFVPQLVVHLPISPSLLMHRENLMISLGVNPWTHGIILGQSLVLFFAILQQRIFDEFFFAAYLIGLCRGSLTAVGRHKEMLEYIQKRNATLQNKVAEEEEALKKKLEELLAERNMLDPHLEMDVGVAAAAGAGMGTAEKDVGQYKSQKVSLTTTTTTSTTTTPGTPLSSSQFTDAMHTRRECFNVKVAPRKQHEDGSPIVGKVGFLGEERHVVEAPDAQVKCTPSVESTPLEVQDDKTFCSSVYVAIHAWSEEVVQYFVLRTYRGKAPKHTYSQGYRVLVAFMQFLMTKTAHLCYLAFLLNYAESGTLLDLLLSLSAVLHGMLILPWAGSGYWRGVLIYNVVSILAKCVMQVIVHQFPMHPRMLYFLSAFALDIGLNRRDPSSRAMTLDIIMDFVVFVSIIIHRQFCFDYGVFGEDGGLLAGEQACWREEKDARDEMDTMDNRSENGKDTLNLGTVPLHTSPQLLAMRNGAYCKRKGGNGDGDLCGLMRRKWQEVSSRIGSALRKYWQNICRRHGAGSDYYTVQFWADSVSLVLFVAVYFVLTGSSRDNILSSVQQDLLPGPLVVILFLAVILMAAERIVYILHSVHLKFGLHILTVLGYHAVFMFWRLSLARETTTPAVILLLVKFFSMMMSALQIRSGYPLHRKHDPFTTNTSLLHWFGHTVYRATPFLFELRLLLDWSVSSTALKLQHWMLLEDVHHTIYQRYVDISDLAWTSPKKGRQFPFFVKMYQGVLGFTACIIALFFPLMLYSTFNPHVGANRVSSWQTEITFGSTSRFYTGNGINVDTPFKQISDLWNAVPQLKQEEFGAEGSLQMFTFPRCSAEVWGATPATRLLLLGQLDAAIKNNTPFVIQRQDEVLRVEALPGAQKRVRVTQRYVVPRATAQKLRDALEDAHRMRRRHRSIERHDAPESGDAFFYQSGEWISLPQFYSPFVSNIPSDVVLVDAVLADCALQLNRVGTSSAGVVGTDEDEADSPEVLYWCLWCKSFVNITSSIHPAERDMVGEMRTTKKTGMGGGVNVGNDTDLYAIVASSDVALNSSFSILPNLGIIALYTTFILALGSCLRNSVTGHAHRVVLMQVSNPDPIAEMLRYIYMARSSASNGCLESLLLEQQLFFELVDMLRSSERVLSLSGRRVDDYDAHGRFQQHLKRLSDYPF